jgi:hypothetical protein
MIADAEVRAGMEEIVMKVPNPQQLHQVPVVPIHFGGRQPMRSSLIAPFLLTLAAYGQGNLKPEPKNPAPGQAETQHAKPVVRRLDSITWNPVTAELSWVVSSWDSMELTGQPASRDTYSMSIDSAIMKFHGEDRRFDPVEAKHVRALMDVLSVYAVESTVWWDQGKGDKTDGPTPDKKDQDKKDGGEPSKSTPRSGSATRGVASNAPVEKAPRMAGTCLGR